MAGKVNTKFVALLGATLILCTLALAGLWFFIVRTDPAEDIARGDGFVAEQQYARAAEQYGKAIHKRRNDVTLLLKYADALGRVDVDDIRRARDMVGQLRGAYNNALRLEPDHDQAFRGLMHLLTRIGRDLHDFDAWNEMLKASEDALRANPQFTLAKQYRGVAQVNRMTGLDLSDDARAAALEDLESVGDDESNLDDADFTFSVVRWHLLESQHLARKGAPRDQVLTERKAALDLSIALLAHDPTSPQRMFMHYRILTALGIEDGRDGLFDQLTTALIADAADGDSAAAVAEQLAVQALRGNKSAAQRAQQLLQNAIARHKSDLRFPTLLGRLYAVTGRANEARTILSDTADTKLLAPPIAFMRDSDRRRQALMQYADLILADARGDNRDKALAEADAIADRMHGQFGQTAAVDLLRGKIALARGDYADAMTKLDRASTLLDDNHPEALLFSAVARMRMGESGAAIEKLQRLTQLRSDYLPPRYELMRLHLGLGQLDELRHQIAAVIAIDPSNAQARRYAALLLAREGDTQRAIAALEQINAQDDPNLAVTLAQLYGKAGKTDQRTTLLKSAYMAYPGEPRLLLYLLADLGNDDDVSAYLSAARDAGMDPSLVTLLAERGRGKFDDDRIAAIEKLIDQENDPFERHYKRFRLASAFGDREKAGEELSKVAKLKPNDPSVQAAQFTHALETRDWQAAQTLAHKAAAENLDMARGQFYQGRLALARGRLSDAIRLLEGALRQRPVYSDGWTYLGEAQVAAGDAVSAEASYRRALLQNPAHGPATRGMAMALTAQGKTDLALQTLRQAVERRADDPQLMRFYLAFEQDHGDIHRALKLRLQREEANPGDVDNRRAIALTLARMGQFDNARAHLQSVETDQGVTLTSRAVAAGIEAMAGNRDGGADILKAYVHSLGDSASEEPWLALARYLAETGRGGEASAAYRQAVAHMGAESTRALREYGDFLFATNQFDEAATTYANLLKNEPNDQRIALRHVESVLRAGDTDQAHAHLQGVMDTFGPSASAHTLTALIAVDRGDVPAALEALDEAIRLEPQRAMTYFERARLRASTDAMTDAVVKDLERAVALSENFDAARAMLTDVLMTQGRRTEAISQMTAAIERNPGDSATRMRLAQLYLRDGETSSLDALLAESEKTLPNEADWPHLRGRLANDKGRSNAAIAAFERALAIKPTPTIVADLASALAKAQRGNDAIGVLQKHREMMTSDPWLWAVAGRVLASMDRHDEAASAFTRAITQARNVSDVYASASEMDRAYGDASGERLAAINTGDNAQAAAWLQMALAVRQMRKGEHAQAAARLRTIEATMPRRGIEFDRLLAMALQQSDDAAGAKAVYERILSSQPDHAGALNNLAYLLAEDLDQPAEAVALAQRAARLQPGNPQVLDTLGWALHRAGRRDEAKQALTQSVAIEPLASNCYHLAVLLEARGEQARAQELLAQAAELAEQLPDTALRNAITEHMTQSRLY